MSTATFNRYAKHAQRRRRAEMKAKIERREFEKSANLGRVRPARTAVTQED